ncbi:MAG: hypothetical protein V2I27_00120 [Erythrobacter sp.]|jgi:hypothetical protein|nr:hypothetical protein [Erythrobacter sp.]
MMRGSRSSVRAALALGLGLALAACGARAPLQPAPGENLPVAPYGMGNGEAARPTAEQLLRLDALAAPERTVELRQRSEERQDDPFNLPPDGSPE